MAIVGDAFGDPLKDAVAPALNVLIKLLAAVALVPAARPFLVAAHRSPEPGHAPVLAALKAPRQLHTDQRKSNEKVIEIVDDLGAV